jgi:hypothetical protein
LLESRALAPPLTETQSGFRNDVIHKGQIRSREEALAHGQAVLDVIAPVLDALKQNDAAHVNTIVQRHVERTRRQIDETPYVSFLSIATTVSIARAHTEPQANVAESVARLRERRALIGW